MPGPAAPWATLDLGQRILTVELLKKNSAISEIKTDLPDSAIEDLGDNDSALRPAAVLVPFIVDENGNVDAVIVMTRTMTVSRHKGQVSFPGGMVEVGDKDLITTALRETQEEIGISPESFQIIGIRNTVSTRANTGQITPVVATTTRQALDQIQSNSDEVDQLHIIPITSLLQPDAYMCEVWDFGEMSPTIHMYFTHDNNNLPVFIWGATAHMLTEILHCLNQ